MRAYNFLPMLAAGNPFVEIPAACTRLIWRLAPRCFYISNAEEGGSDGSVHCEIN